jgi:mono/diheme cytochrome c family protein
MDQGHQRQVQNQDTGRVTAHEELRMKTKLMVLAMTGALMVSGAALAGDAAKGKAVFDAQCSDCHEADEFKGQKAADIVAKTTEAEVIAKHKKKKMAATPAEIADAAAFFATAK